ncbi:hypothetical protein JCM11251_001760 [Rhodosporidiobolus azoricus]
MSSIPPPPSGTNPFLYYQHHLHERSFTRPVDVDGVKARLIALFIVLAILLFASLGNFGVHLYASRLKKRRFWLFRIVDRDGGRHIVSNQFAVCPLIGVVLFIVLFGETVTAWRAWINPGEGRSSQQLTHWVLAVWPTAYAVGWLLSWVSFSAYLQVDNRVFLKHGKKGRLTMPAWLENFLFVGGGLAAVAILAILAGIAGRKCDEMWHSYRLAEDYLLGAAMTWDGSALSDMERAKVLSVYGEWAKQAGEFYHTVGNMCIGAAILPLLIVFINCLMFSFVFLIRRQIKFQLAHLPSFVGGTTTRGVLSATEEDGKVESPFSPTFRLDAPEQRASVADGAPDVEKEGFSPPSPLSPPSRRPSQPPPASPLLSNVSDNVLSLVPLETLSFSPTASSLASPAAIPTLANFPPTSTSPPSPWGSPFVSHPLLAFNFTPPPAPASAPAHPDSAALGTGPSTARSPPTRNQVREIADDVEGAAMKGGMAQVESQMAERIAALVKAEQQLMLIGLSVLLEALFFTIACSWSAPTLHAYRTLTFPRLEAVITIPIWLCGVGIAVAEIGHAWLEWRWSLRRWVRRDRYEGRVERERVKRASESAQGAGGKADDESGDETGLCSPVLPAEGEKRRPSFLSSWRSGGGLDGSGTPDDSGRRTRASSLVTRGLGLGGLASHLSSSHEHHSPTDPVATRIEVAVEVTQVAEMEIEEELSEEEKRERERWEETSVRRLARRSTQTIEADGSARGGFVPVKRKEAWED